MQIRPLKYLSSTQAEPVANFISRASWSGHALVENESVRDETAESRIAMDFTLEFPQPAASFCFAARQSDVGMVRTSLGDEPAKTGRLSDALLQCLEFRSEVDNRKENAGAIEEAQTLELNGKGRQVQLAKPAGYAFVLLGIA